MTAKERKAFVDILDNMGKKIEELEKSTDELEASLYQLEMEQMLEEAYENEEI